MNSIATALFMITLPMSSLTSFAEEYRCARDESPQAVECYRREITQFLRSWVVAWGNGDADGYIEHYLPARSPLVQMTREEWEADRRFAIESADDVVVTLELDSMGISQDGSLDVIFTQTYQSNDDKDVVRKQLFLKRESDGLKIQREMTID